MTHLICPSELRKHQIKYKPGHPPSKIYDYTYGYSMNYYKPMIDYMDRRDLAESAAKENRQLPHLPWNNERAFEEYDPKNPISSYTQKEFSDHLKKTEQSARKQINNFDIKSSYFAALPTADSARISRRLPEHSALDNLYRKDVGKTIRDIEELEMDTYFRYKEGRRRLVEESREEFPVDVKRAIKGKSANQIRNILLANSLKNVRDGEDEDAKVFRQCYSAAKRHRSLSESRRSMDFYNHQMEPLIDRQIGNTLDSVKKEIASFTNKTEEFLSDTRYKLYLMNKSLREQDSEVQSMIKNRHNRN